MNNIFDILFLSFCTNIVIFSIFTVTAFNSIQGLIALIFTFLSTAFLFFLIELEFLSLLILIVYIGAISVLFLFSVMLFNLKEVVRTKNNNLILKSFFFIFILFLFLYLLVLFSITFQKNLDFLIFLIDYDFLYYQNRIIYTFFDQKNEILNFIYITLEQFSNHFSIQNDIFLYTNIISNINNDLYILGQSIYDFYIIYLILTGLVLLIGMYGAISLINNQKPIMQLQHMNRQISTSLFNRTIILLKNPTTYDLVIKRIEDLNFGPITTYETIIFNTDLTLYKYDIICTIISLSVFFGVLYHRYKTDVIFNVMFMNVLLMKIITMLIFYILLNPVLGGFYIFKTSVKAMGIIILLCCMLDMYSTRKSETNAYIWAFVFKPLVQEHKKFPTIESFVVILEKENKDQYTPMTLIRNGQKITLYPFYQGDRSIGDFYQISYIQLENIHDLNIQYRIKTPREKQFDDFLEFLFDYIYLMNALPEVCIQGLDKIHLYLQKVVTTEEYSNYMKNPNSVDLFEMIFKHRYCIKDLVGILKGFDFPKTPPLIDTTFKYIELPNGSKFYKKTEIINIMKYCSLDEIICLHSPEDNLTLRRDLFKFFKKTKTKASSLKTVEDFIAMEISELLIITIRTADEIKPTRLLSFKSDLSRIFTEVTKKDI